MEDKVTKSLDAYNAIRPLIERPEQEECFLICLNQASRIKDVSLISIGSDTAVFMPVKVILKKAILNMATGIIIAHTHPSGNVNPSESDIKETEKLRDACGLVEISLLDHLIIGDESYYSFADGEASPIQ